MDQGRTDVSAWEFLHVEARGASEKMWLSEPGGSSARPHTHWLFKPATIHSNGHRQIGDWTETIAAAVAAELDVPAAQAKLAIRDGIEGVIVRNVRPVEYEMQAGSLVMVDEIGIELRASNRVRTATIGHTLDNICRALVPYGPPPAAPTWSSCTGYDVFVGYLILDALIGNADRHEQNWSVLRARSSTGPADVLAPAYDMESSLGFQLTDEARTNRLADATAMEKFAVKGTARRFDGDLKTPLVDLAGRAVAQCSNAGRERIAHLAEAIASVDFEELLASHPGVSVVARRFAGTVLEINGRRIRDVIRT